MRVAAAIAVAMLALPVHAASAAFSGADGKIAFQTKFLPYHVQTINPDGTGLVDLGPGSNPAWSPDGTRIAFDDRVCDPNCQSDVWIMNADGTGRTRVTTEPSPDGDPTWSPDGSRIAFGSNLNGGFDIWMVNLDGTGRTKITDDVVTDYDPAWSPDGMRIAFSSTSSGRISVMNIDGTGRHLVSAPGGESRRPNWSPDATKIVYDRSSVVETVSPDGSGVTAVPGGGAAAAWSPSQSKLVIGTGSLAIMNADGTNRVTISDGGYPDWQPVVTGYPRPAGASPLRVSLVPAYVQCTSPNRAHGPPLAFGSCNPPSRTAPRITIGTPDANGVGANSAGWFRLRVVPGVPGPPDDSDVLLDGSITDVRCTAMAVSDCGAAQPGGADYAGVLSAELEVRITDKWNGTVPCDPEEGGECTGAEPATVEDLTFPVDMQCAETASNSIGAACSVSTSAQALMLGSIRDTRRAIWQLGQVTVRDPGDFDNPGGVFAVQGVFVP